MKPSDIAKTFGGCLAAAVAYVVGIVLTIGVPAFVIGMVLKVVLYG